MDLWNVGVRRVGTSKRSRMSLSDPSHYVEKKKDSKLKQKKKMHIALLSCLYQT